MWLGFGASKLLLTQIQHLRHAEERLLSMASQFSGDSSHRYNLQQLDTPIEKSAIPLKRQDDVDRLYPESEDTSSFVIHGIHVTSDSRDNADQSPVTTNTPLVLLHGYMNGAAYFYRNLIGLSRSFDSVYSLDVLGWGLSSRPKFELKDKPTKPLGMAQDSSLSADQDASIQVAEEFFVESLEAWRKARGIPRMILCGHSMGGYISVAYAERYPQHVERLVLMSPVGVPKEESKERKERFRRAREQSWRFRAMSSIWLRLFAWNMTVGDFLRTIPTSRGQGLVSQYVNHRLPDIVAPEEKEALVDYLYYNNVMPGSGEYCVSRFLTPFITGLKPTEERIPNLKVKSVSFLYGSHDWMEISGALKVQARCLDQPQSSPAINVYQVQNAGHLLMLDNYREFNAALVQAAGGKIVDRIASPEKVFASREHNGHRLPDMGTTDGHRPVKVVA